MTRFDQVIPPGSEGKVYASVNISQVKGLIEKHIDLETNDPEQPHARVVIRADIKTYIDVAPSEILQFSVQRGQSQTQELILTTSSEKSIVLNQPVLDSNLFDVQMEPIPAAGEGAQKQYRLKVNLKNTAPIGTQQAYIRIPAEGSPQKQVEIRLIAVVRGPISVTPQAVSFVVKTYPEEVIPSRAVDVLQQPDTKSLRLEKAEAAAKFRVIGQTDAWYQVITPKNKVGWVSKAVVKISKESELPTPQTVSIRKSSGSAFKVLDYRSDLTQIKVEPIASEDMNYNLKITLINFDRTRKGNTAGALTVKTDDVEQPELKIPVYIIIS